MNESQPVRVAVDAVGGDHAPGEILSGVAEALAADSALTVVLVGPEDVVVPFTEKHAGRVDALVATEVIAMDEHPASAIRTKRDSSIVVGCRAMKEGNAGAFFSAGSTGACMAAATLVMGRIKGIARPAIATVVPTGGPPVVLLDVGANADCKPENLLQFGFMGAAYATTVLGVDEPKVGLLNIGEEPTKGSQLAQESYALMAAALPSFAGNAEGRDVTSGAFDVIVTDGFTGNVVLKLLEGLSKTLLGAVKDALTATPLRKLAAAAVAPGLRELKEALDPDTYGGAPLLGVRGVCIIGHGSSGSRATANAIKVAAQAIRGGLTERITASVAAASDDSDIEIEPN